MAPVPAPRSRIRLGAIRTSSRRSSNASRATRMTRANSGSPSPARANMRRTAIRSNLGGIGTGRRVDGPSAMIIEPRFASPLRRERLADISRDECSLPSGWIGRIMLLRNTVRGRPMRFIPSGICLLCDEPAGPIPNLCSACAGELPTLPEPCVACGASAVPHTRLCRACAIRRPPVDRTVCALAYAPPVDYLIGRMKFERDLRVVPALAGMLFRAVAEGGDCRLARTGSHRTGAPARTRVQSGTGDRARPQQEQRGPADVGGTSPASLQPPPIVAPRRCCTACERRPRLRGACRRSRSCRDRRRRGHDRGDSERPRSMSEDRRRLPG